MKTIFPLQFQTAQRWMGERGAVRGLAFLVLLVMLFSVQRASAAFQNMKISGVLPHFGDVHDDSDFEPRVSPDGRYTLFVADKLADDAFQLFSVPTDGSSDPQPLTSPISDLGEFEFAITPDSSTVVYRSDAESMDVYELFRLPIDGSAMKTKISGNMVPGGDVEKGFQISPDGQHIVFVADKEVDNVFDIFVSRITSAAAKNLNDGLVAGGDVKPYFQISPDSSAVVFLADKAFDTVDLLFSVPIDGSDTPKGVLFGAINADGDIKSGFQITPDSSTVIFRADIITDEMVELFASPIGGGAFPLKLSGLLVADGDVMSGFQISPDGSRVVFMADKWADNLFELFSVEVDDDSTLIKLNKNLVAGGDVQTYRISPNSSRVVFLADFEHDDVHELYTVPLAGGEPLRLNRILVAGGDVFFDFQITPDSKTVLYRADQAVDQFNGLYSVPLPGGPVAKVNQLVLVQGGVSGFEINPDSYRVVFRARKTAGVDELFQGSIAGDLPTKVNGSLVPGGQVYDGGYQITPDGSRTLYLADQDKDEVQELFVTYEEQPAISFSTEELTKAENSGDFEIEVVLNAKFSAPTMVDYAVTGGSATGDDYFLSGGGTLVFDPGSSVAGIPLQIVDDALPEGDETLKIELSNPQNGTLGLVTSFTLTIEDDDEGGGEGPSYKALLPVVISN